MNYGRDENGMRMDPERLNIDAECPDPDRRDAALERVLFRTYGVAGEHGKRKYQLPPPRELLTDQETRVLQAMSSGLERKDVAKVLGLADDTVRCHLKKAQRVLAAKNTRHACCIALRLGLIS